MGSFTVKNPEFTILLDFYLFCDKKYNEYLCLLAEFTLDPLSNTGISPSPAYRTVLEINGLSVAIFVLFAVKQKVHCWRLRRGPMQPRLRLRVSRRRFRVQFVQSAVWTVSCCWNGNGVFYQVSY